MTGYTELQITSNFSFLRGASHVEELFARAARLGLPALGITDRNTLAGIVRAHQRAEETGIRLIVGSRLDLRDGTALLVYPTDQPRIPACAACSPWARAARAKANAISPGGLRRMPSGCSRSSAGAADAELAAHLPRLKADSVITWR